MSYEYGATIVKKSRVDCETDLTRNAAMEGEDAATEQGDVHEGGEGQA